MGTVSYSDIMIICAIFMECIQHIVLQYGSGLYTARPKDVFFFFLNEIY